MDRRVAGETGTNKVLAVSFMSIKTPSSEVILPRQTESVFLNICETGIFLSIPAAKKMSYIYTAADSRENAQGLCWVRSAVVVGR